MKTTCINARSQPDGRTAHGAAARILIAVAMLGGAAASADAALAPGEYFSSGGLDGMVVSKVTVDPINPDVIYAATAGHGVYKSADGGETFRAINEGLGNISVDSLVIAYGLPTTLETDAESDPSGCASYQARLGIGFVFQTLFVASASGGVFRSVDGGNSWIPVNAGLPDPSAHHLAFDQSTWTLYVSTNDGVFRSADGGASWDATALRLTHDPVAPNEFSLNGWVDCLEFDPSKSALYACLFDWSDGGAGWSLMRSTDAGDSFAVVDLPGGGGPTAMAIVSSPLSVLYVVTYDLSGPTSAVVESLDGGESWREIGGPIPGCDGDCQIHAIAGLGLAFYLATDNGVTSFRPFVFWQAMSTGIQGTVMSVAVDPMSDTVTYAGSTRGFFTTRAPVVCGGDCDGDNTVSVGELITMVNIALGEEPMSMCAAADPTHEGKVSIGAMIRAVDNTLRGCGDSDTAS